MSYVALQERGDSGTEWRARPEEYEAVLHAFERGDGTITFTSMDGAETHVRSAALVSITFLSDEVLAACKERREREALQ